MCQRCSRRSATLRHSALPQNLWADASAHALLKPRPEGRGIVVLPALQARPCGRAPDSRNFEQICPSVIAAWSRWAAVVHVFPILGAHSVSLLFLHLVWATRGRQPTIDVSLDERLHRTLREKALEMCACVHAFGAGPDHVHILVQLPPELSVATLVNRLKGTSSHALGRYIVDPRLHHAEGERREPWQRGPSRFQRARR